MAGWVSSWAGWASVSMLKPVADGDIGDHLIGAVVDVAFRLAKTSAWPVKIVIRGFKTWKRAVGSAGVPARNAKRDLSRSQLPLLSSGNARTAAGGRPPHFAVTA